MTTADVSSVYYNVESGTYCVVEFNFYRGVSDALIVKELSISKPEQDQIQSWVFKAPYVWHNLPRRNQKLNAGLRHQGIQFSWEEGDIPYSELSKIINKNTKGYEYIITDGYVKADFVSGIIGRRVLNLKLSKIIGVPRFTMNAKQCTFHKPENRTHCALYKCSVMISYVQKVEAKTLNEITTVFKSLPHIVNKNNDGSYQNVCRIGNNCPDSAEDQYMRKVKRAEVANAVNVIIKYLKNIFDRMPMRD
jgi:hypothetical protein